MTALEIIRDTTSKLAAAGIENAEREAELLLLQAAGTGRVVLFRDNPEITGRQLQEMQGLVRRRERHEPLQYIIGEVEFLDLKLSVGPGVLIPRPETELLAEYAIRGVKSQEFRVKRRKTDNKLLTHDLIQESRVRILDVCTGSGCIALALARHVPGAAVFAADISETALAYARDNASRNALSNVHFFRGSLLDAVTQRGGRAQCHLVTANPPYIRSSDIIGLAPEIRDWEPLTALDGGPDGMSGYRDIVPAARKILKNHGILMLEIGEAEADPVRDMIVKAGYASCESIRDYAGHERILRAEWIN